MDTRAKVRGFVESRFPIKDLPDTASLVQSRIIDSIGMLDVIAFLESDFGVDVEDDEIVPENIDSIANLVAYVERKLKLRPAS
jgi:acyl carrier protein